MAYLRFLLLGTLVLGACAEDPGATVCPTGIVCPSGTTCAAAQPVCIVNACGNGRIDTGEGCDDGNINVGDGCSPSCTLESCGDGVQVAGERCDDGNKTSGDGCSADCLSVETCGNSIKDVTEVCDDGNNNSGDGCSMNCLSAEVCGNGVKDVNETCDDGNTNNGDACSANCEALAGCGNGVIDVDMNGQPVEECDDGNVVDSDVCRSNCKRAVCGDGVEAGTATGGFFEECDGGVLNGTTPKETAGCNIDCTDVECGDGKVNQTAMEQCDNGMPGVDSAGCDMNNCTIPQCGDNHTNSAAGEACDPGTVGGNVAGCDSDCTLPACGDGRVNQAFTPVGSTVPEACDDGGTTSGDGCSSLCFIESCGNGVTETSNGEQCDDDNTNDLDGCRNNCRLPACGDGIASTSETCDTNGNSTTCDSDCSAPMCGDGFINGTFTPPTGSAVENCDDGNTTAGDGCSATCRIESCGNGVTETVNGEQCDDGDTTDDDECRNNCQLPRCGDGIKSQSETCDTGANTINCDVDCTAPMCNDGIQNTAAGEQCEDGNVMNGDGCSSTCALEPFPLSVTLAGNGVGSVSSNPVGITCGNGNTDCSEIYPFNTVVSLTPSAQAQSRFVSWSGACTGNGACMVTMTQARAVTATFEKLRLTVTKSGTGTGSVTGTGINCGVDCTEDYNSGTMITLTAAPTSDSVFGGWTGACAGTGTCQVTMSQARDVNAIFTLNTFTLTVNKSGTGTGTVTSGPAGIDCGSTCMAGFIANTMVTLVAAPDATSTFTGWSGSGCTGTGNCTVTMSQARTVTATFTIKTFVLTVNVVGAGNVQTTTAGEIDCGGSGNNNCDQTYNANAMVTLTATPEANNIFIGWSGACSGTSTCMVTMDAAKAVTATFQLNRLTVVRSGDGTGTVMASGINCGNDCTQDYAPGTAVTLTASAANGSRFVDWSEPSCGTATTCMVTMNGARTVTANFVDLDTVSVNFTGAGGGTVTWNPVRPACTNDCDRDFDDGTNVTITATEDASSVFTGWGGSCSGTGTCVLNNLTSNASVSANFAVARTLTMTIAGAGTVTATGINCTTGSTGDCTEKYADNSVVTLTATPSGAGTFTGWSGTSAPDTCLASTSPCTLTMSAAKNVTATFSP